jgi:hypothetical protein
MSKRKANKPIQTDREPDDSPQPNATNATKIEEILSKPAHKTTAARGTVRGRIQRLVDGLSRRASRAGLKCTWSAPVGRSSNPL